MLLVVVVVLLSAICCFIEYPDCMVLHLHIVLSLLQLFRLALDLGIVLQRTILGLNLHIF
jgi:hypothetical protein